MMGENKTINTQKLVLLAIFTAIVIILQFLGALVKFQFSITLALVPITVGAALFGMLAGAWLGFVFGLVVLISGDANVFLMLNPAATVFIVLMKGALAGFAAGLVYKLLKTGNKTIAAVSAAIACPVVNTGIFVIGCYAFFLPTLSEWGIDSGAASVTSYILLGMVGVNFLIEFCISLVLSPTISRLIQYRYNIKEH